MNLRCLLTLLLAHFALTAAPLAAQEKAAVEAGRPFKLGDVTGEAAVAQLGAAEPAAIGVLEYMVEGNSVLSPLEIERAVYRHLGADKTFNDIEKARVSLEKAYQDAGYLTVLVDIPEQQVRDGVVTLRVIEGTVERLRVTGSRYYSLGEIKARAPELAENSVPYFPEVQKQLAQLNRSEDRRVTPVLKPGATPGKVEIELKVDDKLPLHGDVELNNRFSANTAPLRLIGNLRYDNAWQKDHSASLSYQTSPQDSSQVRVLSGTYVIPNVFGDHSLAVYGVHSNSNVAAVGTLNVLGKANIVGLRYIVPLPAPAGLYHSLTLGIDRKEFRDTVNLTSGAATETPIGYTPLSLQYSMTRRDATGATQFDAGLSAGMRSFLDTREQEFANKRFDASASFLTLKAGLSRLQNIGGAFSVYGKIDGQTASGALISNEQYAAGGADSVRVYREAEVLGDRGAHASLELRYALPAGDNSVTRDGYVFAYAEGASLRIFEPLPAQTERFNIASAGVGLRMKAWRKLRVWLDLGRALKSTQYTPNGTVRGMFRLGYEF